jgi:predicted NBD/HSP70 family sugar kinase
MLFFLTIYMTINRGNHVAVIRTLSVVALFCILCGVWQLLNYGDMTSISGISDYFALGQQYHAGGGVIGGALIINGHLYRGTTFAAGEFSGVSTQWTEQYSSKVIWARTGSTSALIGRYAQAKCMDSNELNGRIFFANANAGEPEALQVLDEFCTAMATSLHSLQLILDVQKVAIGGGISKQDLLIDTLNKKMDELYEQAYAHRTPATRPEVVRCTFGNDANMIGALYHYLYELKG